MRQTKRTHVFYHFIRFHHENLKPPTLLATLMSVSEVGHVASLVLPRPGHQAAQWLADLGLPEG